MQVTHADDHVTHAVISAGQTQSFKIAQSASFFKLLSDSLYSDKRLAVVREVLCNAWDAHIDAGCTDIAVEVTVNDEQLIVRDFGQGIAPDQIVPIYGTYGASTKVQDDNVTGGFGLGCKAPFAYTDHFETTSFHKGTKTIYNMALSSAEVGGEPSIQTLLSLPTDETGLQVAVALRDRYEKTVFVSLVKKIASLGEMKVNLNGDEIEVIPFSSAKNGWMILPYKMVSENYHHKLYLRYGNVVYPLPATEGIYKEASEVSGIVSETVRGSYSINETGTSIVFQAKPGSISITPSRESLSMTEDTLQTVKGLLTNFIETYRAQHYTKTMELMKQAHRTSWISGVPGKLLGETTRIPNLRMNKYNVSEMLTEYSQITCRSMARNYPSLHNFFHADLGHRIKTLIEAGFDRTGLIKGFHKLYVRGEHTPVKAYAWWKKHALYPLTRDLKSDPMLSADKLFVADVGCTFGTANTLDCRKPSELKIHRIEPILSLLRGVVVLTTNRQNIGNRVKNFPAVKHWFGSLGDSLVYVVQRHPKRIEAAKAFFEKRRYYVIDLTQYHSWEGAPPVNESRRTNKRKAKKGLPLLSNLWSEEEYNVRFQRAYTDNAARSADLDFVIKVPNKAFDQQTGAQGFELFSAGATKQIVRLFGDKGGAVCNSSQLNKFLGQDIPEFTSWFIDTVSKEIKSNKLLREAWSYKLDAGYGHQTYIKDTIECDEQLRKYFKLSKKLPVREQMLFDITNEVLFFDKNKYPNLTGLIDQIKAITVHNVAKDLSHKLSLIPRYGSYNPNNFSGIMRHDRESKEKMVIRQIIITLVEG